MSNNTASRKDFQSWDEVLDAFRALGGIADNVCFKSEGGRRGVFPINPALPFKLFIPEHALIGSQDVELVDDRLLIKQGVDVTPEVRQFFENYHRFTSWSGGGKEEIEAFLNGIYHLPDQVRNLLKAKFYFSALLEKPTSEKILQKFISTRQLTHKNREILFPVLELVNHGAVRAAFETSDAGVSLEGVSENEILSRYCLHDSWMRFKSYGFVSHERWAFSDPFTVTPRDGSLKITVRNSTADCVQLKSNLIAPVVKKEDNTIDISFLIIGDRLDPSVPVRVFREHVQQHLGAGSDEFFETLSYMNRMKFLELLRVCDGYDGTVVSTLKTVCHYQLEALNSAWFGSWVPS